jgi:RimJ/RimL family protein N-acetyltransferase
MLIEQETDTQIIATISSAISLHPCRLSLRSDLGLTISPDFLCHQNFWMRPIFLDDWWGLQNCFFDPDNMKYFGPGLAWSPEQLQNRIRQNALRNIDPTFPGTTGWVLITHDGLAGCFWAVPSDPSNTEVELSYCIGSRFSGKGLTTSAGQLVLSPRLEAPYFVGTIFATAHPDNKGSQHVLAKLGLQPDPARQGIPKFGFIRNYYQKHVLPEKPEPLLWGFSRQRTAEMISPGSEAEPFAETGIKSQCTKNSF